MVKKQCGDTGVKNREGSERQAPFNRADGRQSVQPEF